MKENGKFFFIEHRALFRDAIDVGRFPDHRTTVVETLGCIQPTSSLKITTTLGVAGSAAHAAPVSPSTAARTVNDERPNHRYDGSGLHALPPLSLPSWGEQPSAFRVSVSVRRDGTIPP